MTEYLKQATDFLKATQTEMTVEFLKHGQHFAEDKDTRDIYEITLKRGNRQYKFNFGQSINCSGEYIVAPHLQNKVWTTKVTGGKYAFTKKEYDKIPSSVKLMYKKEIYKNPNFAVPDAYSVLACLQKYEVGTFEDFCSEFGYDTDSRKAEKTYHAVKEEYQGLAALYSDTELEAMAEIN